MPDNMMTKTLRTITVRSVFLIFSEGKRERGTGNFNGNAGDRKGRPYIHRRKCGGNPDVPLASLVKGRGTAKRWWDSLLLYAG
jgi:hypothetical protein